MFKEVLNQLLYPRSLPISLPFSYLIISNITPLLFFFEVLDCALRCISSGSFELTHTRYPRTQPNHLGELSLISQEVLTIRKIVISHLEKKKKKNLRNLKRRILLNLVRLKENPIGSTDEMFRKNSAATCKTNYKLAFCSST